MAPKGNFCLTSPAKHQIKITASDTGVENAQEAIMGMFWFCEKHNTIISKASRGQSGQ